MKKVINKSIFKFVLNFMRDTGGPDLSFDTPRPKFDFILWPGWANPIHKLDHD